MRTAIRTLTSLALTASLAALPVAHAVAADGDEDREEIIITHSKLGPLSDWARMQAHEAEYQRLKAKFDPSPNHPPIDAAAADRALTAPPGQGERSYQQELRDQPTAPAVKAVEDAVAPP
jgi:hypothetical protein